MSLFGGGGEKPKPGGLFGGMSATSSAPAQTSSPFGGLGSTSTSSALPAGSLFAAGSRTTAPATSNPFGSLGSKAPPEKSSTFAHMSASNPQPAQNFQNSTQENADDTRQGQSAYFNSLLEKNKKRAREAEERGESGQLGDMPRLELRLGDISRRVRELGGVGVSRRDKAADSKAHYLLAASGVNPGTTLRDLNTFNPQGSTGHQAQAPADAWDPDSHKYVEQLQQQTTLKMIAEGINRAHRNFDAYLEEHVDINWEEQRKKVYEHFGLAPRGADEGAVASVSVPNATGSLGRSSRRAGGIQNGGTPSRSVFGLSGLQKSVIGTPGVGPANAQLFGEPTQKSAATVAVVSEDRVLRQKQSLFAEKVQLLNTARLQTRSMDGFDVLKEFESIESHPSGDSPVQLTEAYKALIEIVGEGKNGNHVKARHFADAYLDDSPTSQKSSGIRTRILKGSRQALETQFFEHLTSLVARNPREAALGGVPNVINQVRAYIRIRHLRKDLVPDGLELQMIGDDYSWAVLFFLLRSGHAQEAANYVSENRTAFQALDRNFVGYIDSYVKPGHDQKLPRKQQDKINSEYQQRMRLAPDNSLDPYRMACYKIVGRCELSKRSIDGIAQGVEDWIWLQFALARESNRAEEIAAEVYGLEDVRETIREIGQRHFSKASEGTGGYGTFFQLQILGGMFEAAVAYLYSHSYASAVHFGIALDYYGLLRVSDASTSDLLTYTTREQPQINFGRMIGYYTRDFRTAHVVAATDYLALIYLDASLPDPLGKAQAQLCHEALRELVLETREFAQLLGDIRSDGTRIKGAIEQRLELIGITNQEQYLRTVTLQAASVADDSGRTTDAVLLYHLSEDYDTVISIINRALSDATAVELGGEALRVQPVKPRAIFDVDLTQKDKEEAPVGSSFSLTAVDDPFVLATNFVNLYNARSHFFSKIRPQNRDACGLLLRLSEAKRRVEVGAWPEAIDIIRSLSILPLNSKGSIPDIRAKAQNLANLPATVSRLIGPLLLWTITAIGKQRENLLGEGPNGAFDSETRKTLREELVIKAKDLMTFAGLVKLRLGKGVWEGIVGGAGEVGVY